MNNKLRLGGLVLLLFLVVGVTYQGVKAYKEEAPSIAVQGDYNYFEAEEAPEFTLGRADADFMKYASDVIGSKVATTTTYIPFGSDTTGTVVGQATSTYVTKIGDNNEATYTFRVGQASSTSRVILTWEGSNDDFCDTTATSGGNDPLVSEIAWYDIGDFLAEKVHSNDWNSASSTQTIDWNNPIDGQGKSAHLHHLDYQCLRLGIKAASTTIHAQITTDR